jgi:predicted dehydrogenase
LTVRFGILSTAVINDDVIPGFAALPGAELQAVASRSLDRARAYAAERRIPEAYGAYDDLLQSPDIDAVYISLPNGLHREWVERALLAGKHVLCEKPLTVHAGEARELFALAQAQGLVLMEAFMYRHHPQTARLVELCESGAVGEIQFVRSSFSFTVSDPASDIRLSAELAGGALRDVGCYCISLARLVIGEDPESVTAVQAMTPTGVDERTYALLRYPGGAASAFDVSIRSPFHFGASVVGSEAVIEIPSPWYAHRPPEELRIRRPDGRTEVLECHGRNSYELEFENFCRAVAGFEPPRISAAETQGVLAALDLIEASASRQPATPAAQGATA